MSILWHHQSLLLERAWYRIQDKKHTLVQLPTGGGKTQILKDLLSRLDGEYLILSHSVFLCEQLAERLTEGSISSLWSSVLQVDQVVHHNAIFTYQTYLSLLKNGKIPPDSIKYIIIDEAHRTQAAGYKTIFSHHKDAIRIGFTATPQRVDKKCLAREFYDNNEKKETCYGKDAPIFHVCVCGSTVLSLIEDGFLSKFCYYSLKFDKSKLRKSMGDYTALSIEESLTEEVFESVLKFMETKLVKKPIVFLASVKHVNSFVSYCQENSSWKVLSCTSFDGDDASVALQKFKKEKGVMLATCNMLNEGIDVPEADCALLFRPTCSVTIYLQQVGRVLRPSEGKIATIIDACGNAMSHGLPDADRTWHVPMSVKTGNSEAPCVQCKKCFVTFHFSKIQHNVKTEKKLVYNEDTKSVTTGELHRSWKCEVCNEQNNMQTVCLPKLEFVELRHKWKEEQREFARNNFIVENAKIKVMDIYQNDKQNLIVKWLVQGSKIVYTCFFVNHRNVTMFSESRFSLFQLAPPEWKLDWEKRKNDLTRISKFFLFNSENVMSCQFFAKRAHLVLNKAGYWIVKEVVYDSVNLLEDRSCAVKSF